MLVRISLLVLLFSNSVLASDFKAVELEEVRIQYISFFEGGRNPLVTQNGLPDRTLGKELNLIMNSNIFKYGYFDNTVHSMTDRHMVTGSGQFRTVSWQLQLGVRITNFLNVGFHHRSEHLLDTVYAHGTFPVQDGIMINLTFFSKHKREALINW